MATRTYYRDSKGRFHGSAGGRVTFGKAGGFQKGHTSFARASRAAFSNRARQVRSTARSITRGYHIKASYVKSTRTASAALLKNKRVVKVYSFKIPGGK